MPLVDVDTVKLHLRVTHDSEDALLIAYIAAAERQAASFLGRNVYASQGELDTAIAAAPAALAAASVAYDAAMDAAGALEVEVERMRAEEYANTAYLQAQTVSDMTQRGMVVTDSVRTAILLTVASLWEHRGDEDAILGMPTASRTFLWADRVGLGV